MFNYRKTSCILIMVYACGTVVGWDKLQEPETESPEAVLNSMETVFGDQLPAYIAYDRACKLLDTISAEPKLHRWFTATKLIVDTFHFTRHSPRHSACRKFCDPTSFDSKDLVVPMVVETKKGKRRTARVFRKAFNTEVRPSLPSVNCIRLTLATGG